jgi:hypothetical protein
MGFTEAGLVYSWDGSNTNGGTASEIHNAGIPTATLNLFNDGSSPPSQIGAAGGSYAGYFQSIVSAGWNCIAGEGVGGSVIGTVMNYCTYVNYGGIVGDSQGNMYASPWDHPTSGGHGHWDYIETYNNSNQYRDPSGAIQEAQAAGAGHLGILIMFGPNPAADANTYINLVDSLGLDTILFWGGYSESSSACVGLAQELIGHYGAVKDGSGAATTTGGTGAAAKVPVIHCPCRHIWLGFNRVSGNSTSEKIEFKVMVVGTAGWVTDGDDWIPSRPYTGKLQLWGRTDKTAWQIQEFWPAADGTFALWVGSDTAETRYYNVCFADAGSSPAYQTVME